MDPTQSQQAAARKDGLAAMLVQLASTWQDIHRKIKPLIDQPVIRQPYVMSNRTGLVVAAGTSGAAFDAADFQHSLEWPFEVHSIKPTQDAAHTANDWRLGIQDQTFNTPWFKNGTNLVRGLIEDNSGLYRLPFPWVVRPKGGALIMTADNLDAQNPITLNVSLIGCLLIPRA